jgi:hypothetical protein
MCENVVSGYSSERTGHHLSIWTRVWISSFLSICFRSKYSSPSGRSEGYRYNDHSSARPTDVCVLVCEASNDGAKTNQACHMSSDVKGNNTNPHHHHHINPVVSSSINCFCDAVVSNAPKHIFNGVRMHCKFHPKMSWHNRHCHTRGCVNRPIKKL